VGFQVWVFQSHRVKFANSQHFGLGISKKSSPRHFRSLGKNWLCSHMKSCASGDSGRN
jgi:hypothetical protein